MTDHTGNVAPAEAAKQLVDRLDALTLETTGSFWHANGQKSALVGRRRQIPYYGIGPQQPVMQARPVGQPVAGTLVPGPQAMG